MKVKLVAFGIAKDILGASQVHIHIDGDTILDAKKTLVRDFPAFEKLASLRFAVNEDYQPDDFVIGPSDEVVIIPPVSGG